MHRGDLVHNTRSVWYTRQISVIHSSISARVLLNAFPIHIVEMLHLRLPLMGCCPWWTEILLRPRVVFGEKEPRFITRTMTAFLRICWLHFTSPVITSVLLRSKKLHRPFQRLTQCIPRLITRARSPFTKHGWCSSCHHNKYELCRWAPHAVIREWEYYWMSQPQNLALPTTPSQHDNWQIATRAQRAQINDPFCELWSS